MSKKQLVIVESPAKAKTIERYLGGDFTVRSSMGHIRDLPKKGLAIDKTKEFEPEYEISADKGKVVRELKSAVKNSAEVWLATDEDREGEAIAWHLCSALKLNPKSTKRIVFHEITKTAITGAMQKPRTIDLHLVDAQQARRVLDRLVGYELSPVLWKKIQSGLSAGRVQSVAVRLIVEREREITGHQAKSVFKVTAIFSTSKGEDVPAELSIKPTGLKEAEKFLADCAKATFKVGDIVQKPSKRNPSPPFTTSTLQQEASQKLGLSVKATMSIAQRLYENGHITYMRTDSLNLAESAIQDMAKYIDSKFGKKYLQTRRYTTKNDAAQEAHEAIRPTHVAVESAGADALQKKVYKLIRQRTLASQMTAAETLKTEVQILPSTRKEHFIAKGEVLVFDGFMRVFDKAKSDILIPELKKGESLKLKEATGRETFDKAPPRYSEASLVKKLEELGIGRPSTYAPTISTIQDRGYVEKKELAGTMREVKVLKLQKGKVATSTEPETFGADRNKLIPTPLAEVVTTFLTKYFAPIVDYQFTAEVEDEFDKIADGKQSWNAMIKQFYRKEFEPLLKAADKTTRQEATQARELGKDPKTGEPIIARFGRFGPMLQRGQATDDEKPDFAPLPQDTTLDNVTLEQALPMFLLPRVVGTTKDGKEIKANIGRFGPYIQVEKTYVSIKEHSPATITEAVARKLFDEHMAAKKKALIKTFPKSSIRIQIGPYGPYITDGKVNARIPKDQKPEDITLKLAEELLAAKPTRRGRRTFLRNKTK